MKAGIKTSEFWLTLVTNLASMYFTSKGQVSPETGVAIMGGANALYALGRGQAKKG